MQSLRNLSATQSRQRIWLKAFCLTSVIFASVATGGLQAAEPALLQAVGGNLLDDKTFTQWVDGTESAIEAEGGPQYVVWGAQGKPHWRGVKFGAGRVAGVRRMRIGMTEPVTIGSVLVRGGGSLSVLKAGVAYPGELSDDSQWVPAERLLDGALTTQEVPEDNYAMWVLPAGTKTRALRFSHTPSPGDSEPAGWLGGVWMLKERWGNIAPQALAQSVARADASAKLIDESHNGTWRTWQNSEQGAAFPVSPEHPESVTLTWPKAVTLSGVCLLWTGFSGVEIQAFTGPDNQIPHRAADTHWRTIARRSDMDPLYPMALGPNWVPFDKPVQTRSLRLRIVDGAKANHSHLHSKVKEGRRVWLGEVMAVAPIAGDATLASLVLPKQRETPPPVPIRFTLPEAGVVTLVIEDAQHNRVRNLVSETPFPAGDNIAWWDGSDDLLRDPEAARHGVYQIPKRLVEPGTYTVRGLWHKPLKLHYEFSVYNAGKPAWRTKDNTGCWLTTHTPPTSMAFVPGSRTADGQPLVFMGAYIAEGGHGLQWLTEDGVKTGGQHWVGGTWTGAPTLAVDLSSNAIDSHLCYVGSIFEGELRLTAKTRTLADKAIFKQKLGEDPRKPDHTQPVLEGFDGGNHKYVLAGIAAHDGQLVCSLPRQNKLLVVDINKGAVTRHVALPDPRGMTFDASGRLLALSGRRLVRFTKLAAKPEVVIASGLDDPRQVAVDAAGNILISDRGDSHQVKIFSAAGKTISVIGTPGAPSVGPYNPLHMNEPNGIAVDSQGRVWVAECDDHPRRVSLWTAKGELVRAFYGPSEYGGGGVLDPQDRTRFFYRGLEFKLNWKTGVDTLTRVYSRSDPQLAAHYGPYSPDTPLYPPDQKGQRYFTSCYSHVPTGGDNAVFIWIDTQKQARLVAALGDAHHWKVLTQPQFRSRWPEGTKPNEQNPRPGSRATFTWTDSNGDAQPQPDEVEIIKADSSGITVMNDLSCVVSRFNHKNVRFAATFDTEGRPHYDLTRPANLGPAGGRPPSSGGNQSLTGAGGWTINTNAPEPLSPHGLGGKFKGQPRWSYPSVWPGLHASHEAAVPDRPGMVVGHTRLLGGWVNGKLGPMFCVNGNMGNMYLFTADGLFVSTLFHDIRLRPNWAAPVAVRNMDVTNVSLHDENFWPSITQVPDGGVYLVDGARTSLVRVDGLESLAALPAQKIEVKVEDLQRAREWFTRAEELRQQQRGSGVLKVPVRAAKLKVDGQLDDWPATTDWAQIDRRGTKANFNSNSRPYEVSAAVTLTSTHLHAVWRTSEKNLLSNSGETANAFFKNGGCLDIMLATDPTAAPDRTAPVPGDQRLLITRVNGKTRALLYRAKVPGAKEPVAFSSPWRSIHIDVVKDVSEQVTLAADGQGVFEISFPLATLQWKPQPGQTYLADLGVLRGANGQTTQRVYWTNKATAITADVPSEAELTPRLWGKWQIISE